MTGSCSASGSSRRRSATSSPGDIGGAFTATDPDVLVLSFLAQAALVAVAATLMFAVAPIVNRLADGNN